MYKIIWRIHHTSPDFWWRVEAWQDFKVEWTTFRVKKIPVWYSYSRFWIIRFDTVKKKFLWWKWEKLKPVIAKNNISYYRWLYNWSSATIPWKEVFKEIFQEFLQEYMWRIKTIKADVQKIDPN